MSAITPAQLRRGYGPIYRRLSRCGDELSAPGKLVLLNLLERVGQSARVWPAQDRIARDCGFSERTVRAALLELQDRGFLVSERRGRGQTNAYTVEIEALIAWAERPAESAVLERQSLPPRPAESAVLERQSLPVSFPLNEGDQGEGDQGEDHHHQKGGDEIARIRAAWDGRDPEGARLDYLRDLVGQYGGEEVARAIALASRNGARSVDYLGRVLAGRTRPPQGSLEERKRRFLA